MTEVESVLVTIIKTLIFSYKRKEKNKNE